MRSLLQKSEKLAGYVLGSQLFRAGVQRDAIPLCWVQGCSTLLRSRGKAHWRARGSQPHRVKGETPCPGRDVYKRQDYDTLERYRPIQVAYWLVNPYYEKIYGQVEDKKDLLELRNEFLSKEFWEYVLKRLNSVIDQGYDYLRINMEFLSVVKGLFRCNINTDVKQILGKVNAALLKIKDMQQQQD